MPGSGKSTIGKELAILLKYTFLDFDTEIEQQEGATIAAIFSIKGEKYFRQIEAQLLTQIAKRAKDLVVSTGGGTPCYYKGLELMNSTGTTIFIDINPELLINRLKSDMKRPLLKERVKENIRKLYDDRIGVYSNADIKIKADNISIADLIKRIVEELELKP